VPKRPSPFSGGRLQAFLRSRNALSMLPNAPLPKLALKFPLLHDW